MQTDAPGLGDQFEFRKFFDTDSDARQCLGCFCLRVGVFHVAGLTQNSQRVGCIQLTHKNKVILHFYFRTTCGLNFDAKARRQSLDPVDMFHAHIGGVDVCARGLLIAEQIIKDGTFDKFVANRYAGWSAPWAQDALAGKTNLDALAQHALDRNVDEPPVSGGQEFLENLVNRFC